MHMTPGLQTAERLGRGIPLILVHGSGVDHRLLMTLDDIFERTSSWERIYFDLPGFGMTPALPQPGSLEDLADWLESAVIALVGDRPFAIAGNSLGGFLAREMAARLGGQVAAMALLAPVVFPEPHLRTLPPRQVLAREPELDHFIHAPDLADFLEMSVMQTRENWERFKASALPGIRAADQKAIDRLERQYTIKGKSPEARIGTFAGPVLIVAGRQDHVVGYADQMELSESYENCTLAVLNEAGHNIHLEQPESVRSLLDVWQQSALEALEQNSHI